MKTKISHLGRSTVSVILAVMMLLSTMLIGTVSTVNAADLPNATKVYLASALATVDNKKLNTWGSICAYAYNTKGVYTYTDKNTDGKSDWPGSVMNNEGNGIYSIYVDNSATNIIFNNKNNNKEKTGDLTLPPNWKTTPMIYCGDGTATQGSKGWTTYSTTKTLTTPVIAWANGDDGYIPPKGKQTLSVTNTSAYESISGVTYELYKGSSNSGTKTATGVTNTTGVFDVTESAYYTVKVSTTDSDYTSPSSESNTLNSFDITPTYYLTGSIVKEGWDSKHHDGNIISDYYTGVSDNKYIFSKTIEITGEKYFRLINSSDQQYKPINTSNGNDFDVTSCATYDTKKTTAVGTAGAFKVSKAGKYVIYVDQSTTSPSVWVEEVTAPKHSVTYKSNNESMGSVTAVFEGTATSIGTSPASVEEGKSVTFTATANEGYKFDGWYSDADCTTAIPGATDTTYTTTVTADTTVYAKFVAETYNITVKENTNCTVTVNQTAAYGSNVNVTVKAKDGYTVSSISVTNVNANDITGNETEGYTFKMPASNVEITPNVVAVEVTAPKVTLNTVTGESTADVSVKENYPITAFAEAGDAYSKITSTDFSVSGGVEDTDYTKTETFEGSGIYNFVALTKGTFTVTYTATATSINDITKSTSATATLKITASYTDTQNAYLALSKYVDEVKDTTSDGYTTDSYAAFSAALTSAQALLKGLPKADATNASDYRNAKTALETAFNGLEKDVTYYISGRFENHGWNTDAIDMPFTRVSGESNLYKYETHKSVADLSKQIHDVLGNYDANQYFFITTGKGLKGTFYTGSSKNGNNFHENTVAKKLTLTTHTNNDSATANTDNLIVFNDISDSSPNVVIYLDTSDKDNLKLYYSTEKYSVTVAEGVPASVDKTEFAKGETVTVTATPGTGEVLDKVTVVGKDGSTQIETTVSGNTATFKMPDQDVTITKVTFREAKTYTVTFNSSDDQFGTVSAMKGTTSLKSPATVTEGDEVTFTAEPENGYALSGWTVNDASVSPTTNPYTITVQKDTTVVANFKEMTGTLSGYYLLCGTDATFKAGSYTPVPLYTNEEGVYYADFNAADITKNKDYFIIFSTKEDTSGIIVDNNNVTINAVNNNGFSLSNHNENVQNPNGGSNNVKFAKVYINKDEVSGFTIKITNLDVNSKKITYSAEPKFKEAPKNAVNIIAKNGTQTEKFQSMGTTVITPVDKVVFDIGDYNDYTKKATAIKGNKVTVTTTVADKYKDTYYVKGFVVNGESYGIQSGPNDDGVYTLEYQIPDDVVDGTNFEITPVYFLKDSSNCVTFYVEGFDGAVQESWGNTIACYPYYEGVDKNSTNKNAFGAYPGQPLLYEGGKYYTQIPKSITLNGTDKKIVGMTLNNFTLELVHGAISTIKDNKQSYDYDDFVRIANNNYGNNIIYTFKYSTAKDNFGENIVSDATITKADFASPTGNGWEDLTDYNHRKVDLFGNVLTGTDSEKEPLLVVSNGYFENYQGFYATEWTVYEKLEDSTYSKITQIPSSALLLKSKDDLTKSTSDPKYKNSLSDYADAYAKLEAYKNTPALITFESSIKRGYSLQGGTNGGQGGELAERVDGRWYYSMIGEEITAKIAVEYGDTATSTFTKDSFVDGTNRTTTIGAQAYFTNDAAYGETTYKSNIDSSNYFTFTADTIATDQTGQNYVFLGWYLLSDNKYTKLTDAKAPMTGSDTFVARYVKAPKGTVTIDHRLFSAASNPTPPTTQTPGTGSGKCYVTVKVLDKTTGALIKEFAETENSVTLDGTYINSAKDYKLEITLRTVTSGQDKFDKFYYLAQNKQEYVGIDPGTTTTEGNVTTVTRTVDILDSFFTHNEDGTYSFKNTTGSDSIHYYSDIKETKIPYKITFNYEPRLASDAKQYVVTGYFTSEYILNHGAVLTKEFVMSVAPYEDNFFNTIKWDNANITINNDTETKTAVVNSTTSLRTVTVKALNADGTPIEAYKLNNVPEYTSTVVYGNLLKYDNLYGLTPDEKTEIAGGKEYIYLADPEYNGKKFSYWQISTSSDMTDTSAYVTKCFSKEFNYIAYNDYYIWPVYGESQSITGASTTLNFLDYSRNQSTDSEGHNKTDRVFADFALAFDSNGIQLQTYKGNDIKVGMFLEVCGDLESDSNGNVITDINYYKDKPEYGTSDADLEKIKTAILAGSANKNLTYTTEDGEVRKLLNKPIDIKSLDNKNRIEYYVGYNNNDNNQKKLMRAYSYVIVGNEITLCSTCYSFVNYYNVGNMTYTVS